MPKPLVLIVLDGWGESAETIHNPIRQAPTPTFDTLFKAHPHIFIQASGEAVGLPAGQMGNSEVGHLHIGAGRKVSQDLTRIRQAVDNGEFAKNPVFLAAIRQAKETNKAVHVLGLLSPGGVHSHERQIKTLIKLIGEQGIKKNYLHAILDGRDVAPRSAEDSLTAVEKLYQTLPDGKIASIVGRYYAMDRDNRWQRTEQAYDMLTNGEAKFTFESAVEALNAAYARGENDEFVKPTLIHSSTDDAVKINDGDVVIFMNFRADRARQLSHALTDTDFNNFQRKTFPKLASFVSLTEYSKRIKAKVAFAQLPPENTLGEYLAAKGLCQLRIAETEKYAHVTYFLNGGREQAFANEDRILIPSPKVATYDLQPQMSAIELTEQLCEVIESGRYDVIVCNYANPDMVGHTGIEAAANQAVVVVDDCLKKVLLSLQKVDGEALITADHGNIETMFNPKTQQPHTAHTNNLVPLIYVGREAKFTTQDAALYDIAPTILYLLGLAVPKEMTGKNLLKLA